MLSLSSDLYTRCRGALLQCHQEFDTHASLRTIFGVAELIPFRDRLPEAGNKNERIDKTLDYLLPLRVADGRAALKLN